MNGGMTVSSSGAAPGVLTQRGGVTLAMGANTITLSETGFSSTAFWNISGSAANRAYVAGAAGSQITTTSGAHSYWNWHFVNFSGVTKSLAYPVAYNQAYNGAYIDNCKFKSVGAIAIGGYSNIPATTVISVTNSDFRNMIRSAAGEGLTISRGNIAGTAATKLQGCTFATTGVPTYSAGFSIVKPSTYNLIDSLVLYNVQLFTKSTKATNISTYAPVIAGDGAGQYLGVSQGGGILNSLQMSDNANVHGVINDPNTDSTAPWEYGGNVNQCLDSESNPLLQADASMIIHHNIILGEGILMEINGGTNGRNMAMYNNTFAEKLGLAMSSHHESDYTDMGTFQLYNNLFADQALLSDTTFQTRAFGDIAYAGPARTYYDANFLDYNAHASMRGTHYTDYDNAGYLTSLTTPSATAVGNNDITAYGNFNGSTAVNYVVKVVDGAASPNTFAWSNDGGTTWKATANMTTSDTVLEKQVAVKWVALTGHTTNGTWAFSSVITNRGTYPFASHDVAKGTLNPTTLFKHGTYSVTDFKAVGSMQTLSYKQLALNGWDVNGGPAAYDASYAAPNVLAFVQDAYIPSSSLLKGTGYGGVDIGAVAVQVSAVAPPPVASSSMASRMRFWLHDGFHFQ